jgi:alanine-glyoxylate transaminase/serine-glyoxylate transaminase/serine-pyruvate transaminase
VSVTTISMPPGFDIDTLRGIARNHFQVSIAGALGPLTGKGFRIGHLGDQNPAQILGALGGVQAALRVLGVPHGDGMRPAVDCLAASLRE